MLLEREPGGRGVWDWLRNAFAIETRESLEVTARQAELVDRACEEVVRRRMTTPALVVLETGRPLHFVASQAIHFFEPIVGSLFGAEDMREFANFLEQRGSVDYLVKRLEAWNDRKASSDSGEG